MSEKITETRFKPGEQLFKQDTLNAHVVYIKEGVVKVHMRLTEDKDCILKIAPAPSYLGLSTIFGDSINRFSATAIETTAACFIDVQTFKHLINTNGRFAYEIIADLSRDELRLYSRFVNRMHKQVPGRLAGALIYFAKKVYKKDTFELPFTRSELAEYVGASRESVTRQLALLKEGAIIDLRKNQVSILNFKSLEKISQAG
ncbi:MAG: Crp/Fnr family transcriptional regulator [Lewinella sp.]|nr:Crp/Fnr family transcriptional regulator [Lewinella sp.]